MNLFSLFDPTTLAILLPSSVLSALVIASAIEKGCVPWPTRVELSPGLPSSGVQLGSSNKHLPMKVRATCRDMAEHTSIAVRSLQQSWVSQTALYLFGLTAATVIFWITGQHLHWTQFVSSTTPPLLAILIPLILNSILSILITLPLLGGMQLFLFQRIEGWQVKKSLCNSRFLSSIGYLSYFLITALPLIQYVLADLHLTGMSALIAKDLFRVSIALGTIPMSMTGCAVGFYHRLGYRNFLNDARLLQNPASCSDDLANWTDDELHRLIEVALSLKNVDAADKISQYLLERATSGHDRPDCD